MPSTTRPPVKSRSGIGACGNGEAAMPPRSRARAARARQRFVIAPVYDLFVATSDAGAHAIDLLHELVAIPSVTGAEAGCPGANWTGVNPTLTVTDIELVIEQPVGTVIFTCTASDPDGLSGTVPLTCSPIHSYGHTWGTLGCPMCRHGLRAPTPSCEARKGRQQPTHGGRAGAVRQTTDTPGCRQLRVAGVLSRHRRTRGGGECQARASSSPGDVTRRRGG